jgi:hypothetical protein
LFFLKGLWDGQHPSSKEARERDFLTLP